MGESFCYIKISHSNVMEIVGLIDALLKIYEPISFNKERLEKLKELKSIFEGHLYE